MIGMLIEAWGKHNVNPKQVLKTNFITTKFNGSEDFLVYDKLFALVGHDTLRVFAQRKLLLSILMKELSFLMVTCWTKKWICLNVNQMETLR